MEISNIAFPVYKLSQHKPFEMSGVLFYINRYEKDGKEITTIIDDTNAVGKNLALRRLTLLKQKVPLFKLRVAIYFLADLIKLARSSRQWFIDSNGKPFQYKKNRFVNLTFKKIKEVYPITTGGSILVVDSIEQRFKTMYSVTPDYKYAGLLELHSKAYVLYGIYTDRPNDTKRKI